MRWEESLTELVFTSCVHKNQFALADEVVVRNIVDDQRVRTKPIVRRYRDTNMVCIPRCYHRHIRWALSTLKSTYVLKVRGQCAF